MYTIGRESSSCGLRDHIPLQQGLRLDGQKSTIWFYRAKRLSSITTRIKTLTLSASLSDKPRDSETILLLQQGLRLLNLTAQLHTAIWLRDHLPLQQGLRHITVGSSGNSSTSQRPSSTTTRIKTYCE